jgi:hypothetical protein
MNAGFNDWSEDAALVVEPMTMAPAAKLAKPQPSDAGVCSPTRKFLLRIRFIRSSPG